MDDRIRVSDADRDHAAGRLREHFAEGRLLRGELDERISAALNARTVGDLRRVMADLPEPAPVLPSAIQGPQWRGGPGWMVRRSHPRVLPLLLLPLIAVALISGGGWVAFALFRVIVLFLLVTFVARIFFGRFRQRPHRYR
jgi:hypothetical protein